MAKGATKTVILMLLLLLVVSESRIMTKKDTPTLKCVEMYDVVEGDTCSLIAQQHHLELKDFKALNPNLNCDQLFVGQWLCVAASEH